MAVITPVGKFDFDWVPKATESKEEIVKTASANGKAKPKVVAKTSKDLLYEAAKNVMAQFGDTEVEEDVATDDAVEDVADVAEDIVDDIEGADKKDDMAEDGEIDGAEAVAGDVQEAVAELVEKAEAADQLAEAVSEAVEKVEQAVTEVKNAVGGEAVEAVEDMVGDAADEEVVEIEITDDSEGLGGEDLGGEDIVVESNPGSGCCGAMAASVKDDLKKLAGADQLVKTSKISPTTRKKVLKFWKDDLGYVADYAKLMTTDYEK